MNPQSSQMDWLKTPESFVPLFRIQRILSELFSQPVDPVVKEITESEAANLPNILTFIIREIITVIQLRHKHWNIFIELIKKLIVASETSRPLRDFKKKFFDELFKRDNEWNTHNIAVILHFTRFCLKSKLITINEVVNRLSAIPPTFPHQFFLMFCYFAPEIYAMSPGVFHGFNEVLEKMVLNEEQTATATMTMLPPGVESNLKRVKDPVLHDYLCKFEYLCENNFERLIPLIETGCELHSIEYDIYMNDVESLRLKVGKTYDTNRRVEPNPFHPAMFVQWSPSLLDFAAFYGSYECFEFLLKRRARTSFVSLLASAGGDMRILERVKV